MRFELHSNQVLVGSRIGHVQKYTHVHTQKISQPEVYGSPQPGSPALGRFKVTPVLCVVSSAWSVTPELRLGLILKITCSLLLFTSS